MICCFRRPDGDSAKPYQATLKPSKEKGPDGKVLHEVNLRTIIVDDYASAKQTIKVKEADGTEKEVQAGILITDFYTAFGGCILHSLRDGTANDTYVLRIQGGSSAWLRRTSTTVPTPRTMTSAGNSFFALLDSVGSCIPSISNVARSLDPLHRLIFSMVRLEVILGLALASPMQHP